MRWTASRLKARAAWSGSGDTASENVWFPLREKLGATEFLGYETESAEGAVAALVKDGKDVDSSRPARAPHRPEPDAVLRESGGQVGDTGVMTGEGVGFRVTDTQKKAGDLFVHQGTVEQGRSRPARRCAEVDHARRGRSAPITPHASAA